MKENLKDFVKDNCQGAIEDSPEIQKLIEFYEDEFGSQNDEEGEEEESEDEESPRLNDGTVSSISEADEE